MSGKGKNAAPLSWSIMLSSWILLLTSHKLGLKLFQKTMIFYRWIHKEEEEEELEKNCRIMIMKCCSASLMIYITCSNPKKRKQHQIEAIKIMKHLHENSYFVFSILLSLKASLDLECQNLWCIIHLGPPPPGSWPCQLCFWLRGLLCYCDLVCCLTAVSRADNISHSWHQFRMRSLKTFGKNTDNSYLAKICCGSWNTGKKNLKQTINYPFVHHIFHDI